MSEIDKAASENDSIAFLGGEITLREDLREIVTYADKKGFQKIFIETNGTKLHDEKLVNELIEAGANIFQVPVEGHQPRLHDYLMDLEGAYSNLMKGLKLLNEKNVRVETQTVIMQQNHKLLPDIAEKLLDMNVDKIIFRSLQPEGRAIKNYDNLAVKLEKAAPYIEEARKKIENRQGQEFEVKDIPPCTLGGKWDKVNFAEFEMEHWDGEMQTEEKSWRDTKKTQIPACESCRYRNQCRGLWKKYVKKFGTEEIEPIQT